MNTRNKILSGLAIVAGVFGLSKLFKAGNTGKKTSVTITSLNPPKIKNGALNLSANVAFDNPTDHTLHLKKPYLTAIYEGEEIGNSIPSNETAEIKANDRTTIKGINIQIPFIKLGSLALSLASGKIPKMALDITVTTEADGIPHTDTQHFEV